MLSEKNALLSSKSTDTTLSSQRENNPCNSEAKCFTIKFMCLNLLSHFKLIYSIDQVFTHNWWELLPVYITFNKLSRDFLKHNGCQVTILLVWFTTPHNFLEFNKLHQIFHSHLYCNIVTIKLDHVCEIFIAHPYDYNTKW